MPRPQAAAEEARVKNKYITVLQNICNIIKSNHVGFGHCWSKVYKHLESYEMDILTVVSVLYFSSQLCFPNHRMLLATMALYFIIKQQTRSIYERISRVSAENLCFHSTSPARGSGDILKGLPNPSWDYQEKLTLTHLRVSNPHPQPIRTLKSRS